MESKTKISGLTHDDLVTLLATSTYGSNWLDSFAHDRAGVNIEDGDTIEDVQAKCLLAGKKITITDYYAEGETFGDLESRLDEEENGEYLVGLDDIIAGLQKCADGTFKASNDQYGEGERKWLAECYKDFKEGGWNLDLPEAEALMQIIVFGELIYG